MGFLARTITAVKGMFKNGQPMHTETSNLMKAKKKLWRQVYQNQSPWLKPGKVWSANLAAIASAEVARLVTLDLKARVNGDEAVAETFIREAVWDVRNQVEYGLALGGFILKPYLCGDSVRVAFLLPLEFEIAETDTDGTVIDIFFMDYEPKHEKLRVERHVFDRRASAYLITNEVYKNNGTIDGLGSKIPDTQAELRKVPRWADIAPGQELRGITRPLFACFKPATSNTVDIKSPHGVSLFDKALPLIRLADEHLSGIVREFRMKETRLYVSSFALDATKRRGERIPYLEDDLYVKFFADDKQGTTFFEVFSPEIRHESFLQVFNKYQQMVEDNIGLMHGTFSAPDAGVSDRTATAIRESKHRTYSTVSSNQMALRKCLEGALYAVATYMGKDWRGQELVLEFDDTLIRDPREALTDMLDDVSMGLVKPEIYLAKKYAVSKEDALKMMPQGTQLLRDNRTALIWNQAELTADTAGDGSTE